MYKYKIDNFKIKQCLQNGYNKQNTQDEIIEPVKDVSIEERKKYNSITRFIYNEKENKNNIEE